MITSLEESFIQSIVTKYGQNVAKLNLSNNGIQCIKNIDKLSSKLEKLNLSKNDLIDIRPLSSLVELRDLNISCNHITDLSPLVTLHQLVVLDVSDNKISSIDSIRILGHLHIKTLYLRGNLVCSTIGYPVSVFACLPTVDQVDDWDRFTAMSSKRIEQLHQQQDQVEYISKLQSPPNTSSASASVEGAATTVTTATAIGNNSNALIKSLQSQINALEKAFEIQENALGANGVQVSTNVYHQNVKRSVPASTTVDAPPLDAPPLDAYPYVKLIQVWRKETVKHIALNNELEDKLSVAVREAAATNDAHMKLSTEYTTSQSKWNERYNALVEKNAMLQEQLATSEKLCIAESQDKNKYLHEVRKYSEILKDFKSLMEHSKVKLDTTVLNTQLEVMQSLQKLQQMEERLAAASERVAFATEVVAQKEISLRNSTAALEAERKMLVLTHSSSKSRSSSSSGYSNCKEVDAIDSTANESEAHAYISDIRIQPESEAILKALFRGLDGDDTGCVGASALLAVLTDDEIYDTENSLSLKSLLSSSMHASQWQHLLERLADMRDKEITWGEFLLQLLPVASAADGGSDGMRARLTIDDMLALRTAGLMGDDGWGIVRMRVVVDSTPSMTDKKMASSTSLHASPMSPMQKEIHTLLIERSFLLNRLQTMNRTLERRAEGIKYYFDNDIKKGALRESRLQLQNKELHSTIEVLKGRCEELHQQHAIEKDRNESKVKDYEQVIADLRDRISLRKDESASRYESIISDEKSRYNRLEMEHSLLQRESGKKEVRLKSLQRDTMRLQAAISAAANDSIEQKNKIDELTHTHSELVIRLSACDREKGELTQQVASLESDLKAIKAAALPVRPAITSSDKGTTAIATSTTVDDASDVVHVSGTVNAADLVRQQMSLIRSLTSTASASKGEGYVEAINATAPTASSASSISSSTAHHLAKLLRLAEEAINKS